MKYMVTVCTMHGINKLESDDSVLIGKTIVNDSCAKTEIAAPAWVCLCDGVGGNAGGREASMFVCSSLAEQPIPQDEDGVKATIETINHMLLERAVRTLDHRHMATTATVLLFLEDAVYLAHIGNTRLYALRGGFLQQITEDHTTYRWLINTGNMEAAEHCNKSEIRGAMGGGSNGYIKTLEVKRVFERKLPSKLLMTTDGIHDTLTTDEMEEIISNAENTEACVRQLCAAALAAGTDDDRSAIMIEYV